jgi:hypothetical protein
MVSKCITIVAPKSGLSAMVDKNGDVSHYRKWWMSEKTPRTEMDEIEAAFAIINLQSDNLGKPIYLVHGIDKGELANRVMIEYLFYNNKNKAKIQGYITVNTETGEYIGHNLDGTEWLSRDLDPVQKNK